MLSRVFASGVVVAVLSQCGSSTPQTTCSNPCNQGDMSCAGGIMSTCQSVDGCLEFVKTSTCPSGVCQDETTCATAPNCGSFSTCDTCTAIMQINCFWCPASSSCVATSGTQDCMGGSVGGNDSLNLCADVASCAPCSVTTLTVCADTQFQCSCAAGKTPTDTGCVLDANQQYCCTS